MNAVTFCTNFVNDMLDGRNTFDQNYNLRYANNLFYSYDMPICEHVFVNKCHVFRVIEKDQSPSVTTTKHIQKLIDVIEEFVNLEHNVSIDYVSSLKGAQNV